MKKILFVLLFSLSAFADRPVDDKEQLAKLNDPMVSYSLKLNSPISVTESYAMKSPDHGIIYVSIHMSDNAGCYIYWQKRQSATAENPYILSAGNYKLMEIEPGSTARSISFLVQDDSIEKIQCDISGQNIQALTHKDLKKSIRHGSVILEESRELNAFAK